MPQMKNTVTGRVNWMPDSYIGQFPFVVVEEVAEPVKPAEPVSKKLSRKKKADYVHPTFDADGDGLVQDGTIFEREEGVELSEAEVAAILEEAEEK